MNRDRFRLEEISFRGLCVDLLRNGWMILLASIAALCAAIAVHNLTYVPAYTSTATLVVSVKGNSDMYASLSTASQMADVFGQVFQSEALREKIAEDVGNGVQGTVTCSLISETNLLVLEVTSPEPRQAYLFIHSALEHYDEVSGQVFANAELQTVQEPNVPVSPSNTSWAMQYRYILMLVAAAVTACIIVLSYMMRFTVKNAVGAERQLDGRIRGVIPYERKNTGHGSRRNLKQALLITSPAVSMNFAEAGRQTEAGIEYHMRSNRQKVLLVTSIGENEGKSTVAANLALSMAEKHRKVLLVDGDLRKPALYKIFERDGEERMSFEKVLDGSSGWREAVNIAPESGIHELFQFGPVTDPSGILKEEKIIRLLEEWKQEAEYIIIDCSPAAVSADAEVWVNAADTAVLVVREDWTDIRAINDAVDMVRQNGTDFAGFILNAFHREWTRTLKESRYGDYGSYSGTGTKERGVD